MRIRVRQQLRSDYCTCMLLSLSGGVLLSCLFFFFNDTATTEIYTLSLHDALPICNHGSPGRAAVPAGVTGIRMEIMRSEEHTSELQSRGHLVCRLLLEKKKQQRILLYPPYTTNDLICCYPDHDYENCQFTYQPATI